MYDLKQQVYQGNGAFRRVTKLGKRKKGGATYWKGEKGGVSIENFKIAKSLTRHSPSRLCFPLDDFERYVESIACKSCGQLRGVWGNHVLVLWAVKQEGVSQNWGKGMTH